MARIFEMKFGDFQAEKRYKELERELKLARLRQQHDTDEESLPPALRGISNVNTESINSSTNVPVLHISKTGNDVVSSSKNLKNILSKKGLNEQSDTLKNYHMMQPPKSYVVPHTSKKKSDTFIHNVKALPMQGNKYISSYIESNKKRSNFELSDTTIQYTNPIHFLQSDFDNLQGKSDGVFTKWKVMLTRQGHLVIKGTLQCQQNFQSNPIVRRLSSTSIESVCKNLYHLQGNIIDDEHELPEYIKAKFYNGFPDDWENVHQIWRMFVQQGCKVSFRWPTPIADSDDDLKSEVTDVTYQNLGCSKYEVSDVESSKRSQSPELPAGSEYSLSVSRRRTDKTFTLHNCTKKDSFTQTSLCGITENSFYNVNVETPLNHYTCDVECDRSQENTHVECPYTKIKDELIVKLNSILNSLLDTKCPKKRITEIIAIGKFFNDIISVHNNETITKDLRTKSNRGEQNKEIYNESGKSKSISPLKDVTHNKNTYTDPIVNHKFASEEESKIASDKVINNYEMLSRKRTFTEMNKNNGSDSSDSENEIYAGVPRIPANRQLRSRRVFTKPYKRKIKRTVDQTYCGSKQRVSNTPSAENYVDRPGSKQRSNTYSKSCFPNAKRRGTNSNVQSEISKLIDSDTTKVEQLKRLNNLGNNKNVYKVQKCFMRENSTPIHRLDINNFYNLFNEMKNKELKSTLIGNYKNIESETNFNIGETSRESNSNTREMNAETNSFMGISNEINDQHRNYTYCEPSNKESLYRDNGEIAKPTIVSSIPTNIDVTKFKTRHSLRKLNRNVDKNENKITKDLNIEKKISNRMQSESPTKFHPIKKANSTLFSNNKKDLEKHVEAQPATVDSTTLNIPAQPDLKTLKDNQQDSSYSKPKSLRGWIPKVLCNSELSLIFEGTLLNDAGQVMHRKFQTDIVLRRITAKLIETVDHQFYQLIGDLNDTKHVIPKQLLNYCRYGCPSRIDQFCKTWKLLLNDDNGSPTNVEENLNDSSIDSVNVAVSSKGRRIIRPLNYWAGERITTRGNDMIYSPGNNSLNSFDQNKSVKGIRIQNSNVNSSSDKLESSLRKSVNKTTSNSKQIKPRGPGKFMGEDKERNDVQIQESNYSNDSENISPRKKQRVPNTNNESNVRLTSMKNSCEASSRIDETKLMKKSSEATENTDSEASKVMYMKCEFPSRKYGYRGKYECMFSRGIMPKDDILSDDVESRV